MVSTWNMLHPIPILRVKSWVRLGFSPGINLTHVLLGKLLSRVCCFSTASIGGMLSRDSDFLENIYRIASFYAVELTSVVNWSYHKTANLSMRDSQFCGMATPVSSTA